jgi:hypothetical protein
VIQYKVEGQFQKWGGHHKRFKYKNNKYINEDPELEERVTKHMENKLSVWIKGHAGAGKTWFTENKLPNILSKLDKKKLATTMSYQALKKLMPMKSESIDVDVLSKHFVKTQAPSKIISEMTKKYSAIVIDEFSMLTCRYWHLIYDLHRSGMIFIFIGDPEFQLGGVDKHAIDPRFHDFFKDIVHDTIEIIPGPKSRSADPELHKEIEYLREHGEPSTEMRERARANNPETVERHLCWTIKKRDEINASFEEPSMFISKVNADSGEYVNNEMFRKTDAGYYSLDQERVIDVKSQDLEVGHAVTVNCAQGSDIDEPFRIHHHQSYNSMPRRNFYVAFTRATRLGLIHFNPDIQIAPDKPYAPKKNLLISNSKQKGYIYGLYRGDEPIFYIGSTDNMDRRLEEHRKTKGENVKMIKISMIYIENEADLVLEEYRHIKEYLYIDDLITNKVAVKEIKEKIAKYKKYLLSIRPFEPSEFALCERPKIKNLGEHWEIQWMVDGERRKKRFKFANEKKEHEQYQVALKFLKTLELKFIQI